MPSPYHIATHAESQVSSAALTALCNAAFAEYPGAIIAGESWMDWFRRRPGCAPELCGAAWYGRELVSSLFVTEAPLRLGGRVLRAGIVDTVMTAPAHQKHGLARELLTRAIGLMRERGFACSLLYTNPRRYPYGFYQSLGYRHHATAELLAGPRPVEPPSGECWRLLLPDETEGARRLVNASWGEADGFVAYGEDLWEWHRLHRPEGEELFEIAQGPHGAPTGGAAFTEAGLLAAGREQWFSCVLDIVPWRCRARSPSRAHPEGRATESPPYSGGTTAEGLAALLCAAPRPRVALVAGCGTWLHGGATELGLRSVAEEAAMLLPLNSAAEAALQSPPSNWYASVESIVGA